MTKDEAFTAWAPSESPWSDWAKPVLFAQLPATWEHQYPGPPLVPLPLDALGPIATTTLLMDLPGELAVAAALSLARQGHRPVPLFNGAADHKDPELLDVDSPITTHGACINTWPLMRALWLAAAELQSLSLPPNAPPAFLLDSRRRLGDRPPGPGIFDNRWLSFPTDFPSARMLQERGITTTLLLTNDAATPAADLAHTLLRYQQAGLKIHHLRLGIDTTPQPITLQPPNLFRAAWYQFTTTLGLRRNLLGGYGGKVPNPASAG
jgi:hypothetical protein